jgi:hypothetical protein
VASAAASVDSTAVASVLSTAADFMVVAGTAGVERTWVRERALFRNVPARSGGASKKVRREMARLTGYVQDRVGFFARPFEYFDGFSGGKNHQLNVAPFRLAA